MDPSLYSTTEAIHELGIGKSFFYKLISEGQVETIKLGRRRLVVVRSVKALIAQAATQASEAKPSLPAVACINRTDR